MIWLIARIVFWVAIVASVASLVVGGFNLGIAGEHDTLHLAHLYTVFAAGCATGAGLVYAIAFRIVAAVRKVPARFPLALMIVSLALLTTAFAAVLLAGIGRLAWA